MYGYFSEEPAPVRFNSANTKFKKLAFEPTPKGYPPLWCALRARQLLIELNQSGAEEVAPSTTP